MKNTVKGLKAGVKGFFRSVAGGNRQYEAAGRQILCTHCGGDTFEQHEAMLNTTGATLLNLDWLNQSGTALICDTCGLIQWFGRRPGSTE